MLYVLCLNPLIESLEKSLSGVKIGRHQSKTVVTAYADDVTIFLTSVEDVPKLKDLLYRNEAATGAKINTYKSKTMALGRWDTALNIMDTPNHTELKILGFNFTNSVNTATAHTRADITSRMRATAQTMYHRDLSFDKRLRFTQDYLL